MGRPTTIDTGGELDEDAPDVDTDEAQDEDAGATDAQDEGADTDEDDESEADNDNEDDESEELDDAAFLESLTPAQRKAFQARVARANANGRKWRLRATGKDTAWKRNPTPGDMPRKTPAAGKGAPVPDTAAIKAELAAELAAELREERRAEQVQTAAERELTAAGLVLPTDAAGRAAALARARKLLDLDGLEPDDVADEVAELRHAMPGLFAPARRGKARKSGVVGPVGSAPARRKRGAAPAAVADLFD